MANRRKAQTKPDGCGGLPTAPTSSMLRALRSFEMRAVERGSSNQKVSEGREDEVGRRLANLLPALATLTSDLDSLIPAWIRGCASSSRPCARMGNGT